jgi:hypothetical protein
MPSETPGAGKALSSAVFLPMACAQVNAIGSLPICHVLGAMCRIQGIHPSPRWTPAAKAAVTGGRINLAQEGFQHAPFLNIFPSQPWLRAWSTYLTRITRTFADADDPPASNRAK